MTKEAILLLLLTVLSALYDLKQERIPNRLLLAGFFAALLCRGVSFSLFAGLFLPLCLLGPFFLLRMIGAGDIKLLCVIGAFAGPEGILSVLLVSFLCGGLLSALLLARRGNLRERFRFLTQTLMTGLRTGRVQPYLQMTEAAGKLHLAVPILAGVVWYCCAAIFR